MSEIVVIKRQRRWLEVPCELPQYRVFHRGEMCVFAGREPAGWAFSIRHNRRWPTWEEVQDARREFIPHNVTMAIVVPATEESVIPDFYCIYMRQIPNWDELDEMEWQP